MTEKPKTAKKKLESKIPNSRNEVSRKAKKVEDLNELLVTLQMVQADFENYRKRIEKEKEQFAKCASSEIIKQMLPVLDNFDAALKNFSDANEFLNGVRMIHSQMLSVFEKEGLNPIDAEGKKFNPYVHEALMQEASDKGEGIILEEFQKGYMLGDVVLRHSKVKVSMGKVKK